MTDQKKADPAAPFNDISEFMQKMWNPFGVPIPGFALPGTAPGTPGAAPVAGVPFPNPAAMFPTLDPDELARKIDELRVIEAWLQMSLNMMQLSIKTMELQKASLEALRAPHAPDTASTAGRKP